MTCQDAEKLLLLKDSGELNRRKGCELDTHLIECTSCRKFQHTLESATMIVTPDQDPPTKAVQNVLREARLSAPQIKKAKLFFLKPAFAMATAVMIGMGIFYSISNNEKIGMELVVTETQLLNIEDQIVRVMYSGLSEDDLAFNFLMTYEEI